MDQSWTKLTDTCQRNISDTEHILTQQIQQLSAYINTTNTNTSGVFTSILKDLNDTMIRAIYNVSANLDVMQYQYYHKKQTDDSILGNHSVLLHKIQEIELSTTKDLQNHQTLLLNLQNNSVEHKQSIQTLDTKIYDVQNVKLPLMETKIHSLHENDDRLYNEVRNLSNSFSQILTEHVAGVRVTTLQNSYINTSISDIDSRLLEITLNFNTEKGIQHQRHEQIVTQMDVNKEAINNLNGLSKEQDINVKLLKSQIEKLDTTYTSKIENIPVELYKTEANIQTKLNNYMSLEKFNTEFAALNKQLTETNSKIRAQEEKMLALEIELEVMKRECIKPSVLDSFRKETQETQAAVLAQSVRLVEALSNALHKL